MSAVVLVKCSGCFKCYPINPNKHKDRDTRYCPFCRTPRKIRGRFGKFLPNPDWQKQKEEQATTRRVMKEMRTGGWRGTPPPILVNPLDILKASLIAKKLIEEEQRQKSAKPNP